MDTDRGAYATVARLVRPHGVRGEIAAEILTDFPEHLRRLDAVDLWDGAAHTAPHGVLRRTVRSCWLSKSRGGQAIFHFQGVNSVDDAKKLVGYEVQIPLKDRFPLPEGSYYVTDLVGCEVTDTSGRVLGIIREVQSAGEIVTGTPNLAVESPSGELLIPLAQDICVKIDLGARRITVALPEGLADLNPNS